MSQIVPHQSSDDIIIQFCNWAELEVIEDRGEPMRPIVYFLETVMDHDPKRKGKKHSSAKQYWKNIKQSMKQAGFERGYRITPLKVLAQDGKKRMMDCGNIQAIRRILMHIRDSKPEILRLAMAGTSPEKLRFIAQNLFEGRNAYENQFYLPKQQSLFGDDPFEDLGYKR